LTVIGKKTKKTTTREWEGMGVILPGVERDFPPVFSWDWDGKRLKFGILETGDEPLV